MLGADVTPKVGEGIGLDLWGNSPIRHALLAAPGTSARNAAGGGAVGGGWWWGLCPSQAAQV